MDHAVPKAPMGMTSIPNAKANRYTGKEPSPLQPATHSGMQGPVGGHKGSTVIPNAPSNRYHNQNLNPMQPPTHEDMED